MNKLIISLILVVLVFLGQAFAQTQLLKVRKFKTPLDSPAATAVAAQGDVVIAITIDQRGDVTSAEIESGSPLLTYVSLAAAKQWKFNKDPTLTERRTKLTFAYSVKLTSGYKVVKKSVTYKFKFIKPFRLEIERTIYYVTVY